MACEVTITSVTATGPPLTAVVSGTATVPDCTSVKVTLECDGEPGPTQTVQVDPATGKWTATFVPGDLKGSLCSCGGSYVVTAECVQSPKCEKGVAQGEFDCENLCPTATVSAEVGECTPDGYRNVAFNVTLTPGTGQPIITLLDYGDGYNDGGHPWSAGETTYSASHTYVPNQAYTATFTAIYPTGCPVLATVAVGPLAACPCPDLELSVSVSGCADPGTATATFTGTLTSPGANCMYNWSFGDGNSEVTTTPTTTHSYGTPGSYPASVAVTCGACEMTQGATVVIPQCQGGSGGGGGGGGGEGFGCFAARVIMTIAAILAIVSLSLAACVPQAATVLAGIAAGLGLAAATAGILWGIFCPKPCAWALLLAWQVSVGVGFVLLYFTTCCHQFWFIGLPLIAAGIALMFVWKRHCNMSTCEVLKELSIALSSVILPLLGWLGVIPALAACINHVVAGILSTLAAAVALAALHCASSSQTTSGSTQQGTPLRDLRHPDSQI